MTQFNVHGCTHFQRKALVTEAMQQQAPPNKNANEEYEEFQNLGQQVHPTTTLSHSKRQRIKNGVTK